MFQRGIVVWKAVSKTATCLAAGNITSAAAIPW